MPSTPASAPLWKQEVNRRLAAHRSRRPMPVPVDDQPVAAHQASSRAAEVAARVAQRYASRPSYSEPSMEPSVPVQAARPVRSESAPVAARTAPEPSAWLFDPEPAASQSAPAAEGNLIEFPRSSWIAEPEPAPALSIFEVDPVLFETPVAAAVIAPAEPVFVEPAVAETVFAEPVAAFFAPVVEEPAPAAFVPEPEPVFFVEETKPVSFIFEPEPVMTAAPAVPFFEQPAAAVAVEESFLAPASEPWIPMPTVSRYPARRMESEELLEMLPDPQPVAPKLEPADMGRRLLAGFVDASLIGLTFLGFAAYTVRHMEQVPSLHTLESSGGIALALIALLYMATFSILSIATPGMRYAGLALSSFACRGTRPEQRLSRFGALLLALAPAGLGVLWAIFDEEGLGWHDRLSQTYPRKR